jgi:hypothetical protein
MATRLGSVVFITNYHFAPRILSCFFQETLSKLEVAPCREHSGGLAIDFPLSSADHFLRFKARNQNIMIVQTQPLGKLVMKISNQIDNLVANSCSSLPQAKPLFASNFFLRPLGLKFVNLSAKIKDATKVLFSPFHDQAGGIVNRCKSSNPRIDCHDTLKPARFWPLVLRPYFDMPGHTQIVASIFGSLKPGVVIKILG